MYHLIISNILLLLNLTSDELKSICELLLTVSQIEELVEGQHLFQLILKLVALGPGDQFMRTFAAQLECTLRRKSVLRSVNHGELGLVKLL